VDRFIAVDSLVLPPGYTDFFAGEPRRRPIAFFVLAVALLSLITTPLLPWVAIVFNNANWTLATLVIGIVHLFAQIPGRSLLCWRT
jgi:hypothetical protein